MAAGIICLSPSTRLQWYFFFIHCASSISSGRMTGESSSARRTSFTFSPGRPHSSFSAITYPSSVLGPKGTSTRCPGISAMPAGIR